jgi:hypothetical protein
MAALINSVEINGLLEVTEQLMDLINFEMRHQDGLIRAGFSHDDNSYVQSLERMEDMIARRRAKFEEIAELRSV